MAQKHKEAAKKRMQAIGNKSEVSAHMREIALSAMAKRSPKERRAMAMRMVAARQLKRTQMAV